MAKQIDRPRLGRGLSALLAGTEPSAVRESTETSTRTSTPNPVMRSVGTDGISQSVETTVNGPWRLLPLDAISPNPHQPRRHMDEAVLAELAASLKSSGLIQPIVVREVDGAFQLIAGERRFRAARLAGLTEIPCIVREVDSYMQAQLALVENIHRADLNPIDRAAAYSSLMTQLGLTQAELAARLGEQRSSIANYLRLLDLVPTAQDLIRDGRLTLGHAKVLAGITDTVEQLRLADLCTSQDLSVRNLERLVQSTTSAPATRSTISQPSAHLKDLETNLSRQIGLRVEVRAAPRKGRGRVVIHYTSLDQFDELVRKLGVDLTAE
ncbi:MAG: ParB/RepB/Spo0J family partition protein [Burkholderiales bacterium]|nr:ParB/RepB/Spo0J family partition protein [Phycisphaerae bacterium]